MSTSACGKEVSIMPIFWFGRDNITLLWKRQKKEMVYIKKVDYGCCCRMRALFVFHNPLFDYFNNYGDYNDVNYRVQSIRN
jgi:hypothetical protein